MYKDFLRKIGSTALLMGTAMGASTCLAGNPIITSIFTADASAHVWQDGRLYLYPSRDVDPAKNCDWMDKYHVFSTDDMVHWRDEGQILQASQVKWGRPDGGFMWAPDCVYKKGTYYFYFPHPSGAGKEWGRTWQIGVATSHKPASDFVPLDEPIKGLEGSLIDPCVFIDTDGQAYLYYGGGGKPRGVKLKDNMVEIDGAPQPMAGLENFHEATWVFKRNNVYYLTYADGTRPTNLMRYATSDKPLGPWTYKGVYLDGTDCPTTHGSVIEYKGQWYQFYHNQSISGSPALRSVCVDKLAFNDDGTIQKVTQTQEGVPSVGTKPYVAPASFNYDATTAKLSNGAVLEEKGGGAAGKCIRGMKTAGATCEFNAIDGGPGGRATITVLYACNEKKAKLDLKVNGVDQSLVNAIPTGGADQFTGRIDYTMPLKPGKTNTIILTSNKGDVSIAGVSITPIAEK